MQKRELGNSGREVSDLGLGCMRMTFADAPIGDKQEMIAFLHAAVDRGITFFDTKAKSMPKILILGANGQLARNTTGFFLKHPDVELTLYLRRADRLRNPDPSRVTVVEGDVLDLEILKRAMHGQDVVYANLAGGMEQQARAIVNAMHATGVRRLIFISSMGIYGEVPGQRYSSVLDPYRDSAAVLEASDLDYTILRPVGSWRTTRSATGSRRKANRSRVTTCRSTVCPT